MCQLSAHVRDATSSDLIRFLFSYIFRTFVSRSVRIPEDPLTVFVPAPPVAVIAGTISEHVDTFAVPKPVVILADVYVAVRQQSFPATMPLAFFAPFTLVHLHDGRSQRNVLRARGSYRPFT